MGGEGGRRFIFFSRVENAGVWEVEFFQEPGDADAAGGLEEIDGEIGLGCHFGRGIGDGY